MRTKIMADTKTKKTVSQKAPSAAEVKARDAFGAEVYQLVTKGLTRFSAAKHARERYSRHTNDPRWMASDFLRHVAAEIENPTTTLVEALHALPSDMVLRNPHEDLTATAAEHIATLRKVDAGSRVSVTKEKGLVRIVYPGVGTAYVQTK